MKQALLLLGGLLVLLFLASCTQDECSTSLDCSSAGACFNNICQQGQCVPKAIQGCCGNTVCEEGENVCSCEKDCSFNKTPTGKCEGKVQLPSPYRKNTFIDADYSEYYCLEQSCEVGIAPKNLQELQLRSDHGNYLVRFELVTTLSDPFVLGKGNSSVRVRLTDRNQEITSPILVTQIQLLSADQLLGESTKKYSFNEVGDVVELQLPISMVTQELEGLRPLSAKLNFEYNYSGIKRESYTSQYNPVMIINPAKAP